MTGMISCRTYRERIHTVSFGRSLRHGSFSTGKYAGKTAAADFRKRAGRIFPEADLILLEGFKYSTYPKIEIIRKEIRRKVSAIRKN